MDLFAELSQAFIHAWARGGLPAVVEAPEKPATADATNVPEKSQPPSWVNAPPKLENDCYWMSVRVGPYTTPLECQRELGKAVQGAVADYAELSLGPVAATMRLPDSDVERLVRDRWTEVRPMQIGGASQDMFSLHALLVFDSRAQNRMKIEAQRIEREFQQIVIKQRVKGGALLFGGAIGLLALTWGGLKWVTRREQVNTI